MQTPKTITLFATVSNSAASRTSKNGRNYTAFGFPFSTTTAPGPMLTVVLVGDVIR